MKHLKRFTCMAMAAAMALSLAACGGTPSDAGGSGSEAGSGDQKTIVVGTSIKFFIDTYKNIVVSI